MASWLSRHLGIRLDSHTRRVWTLAFVGMALPAFSHHAGAVGLPIVSRIVGREFVTANAVGLVAVMGSACWPSRSVSSRLVASEATPLLIASVRIDTQAVASKGVTTPAVGLSGIDRYRTCSAQDVNAVRDRFQMRRIEASAISAQVVYREPFGDTALPYHVGGAMARTAIAHSVQKPAALAISIGGNMARPIPALARIPRHPRKQFPQISSLHGREI